MTQLIAITGPIAAGATTLARRLCELRGWTPMFERDVEATNPFFRRYNADPPRWAFPNQIGFLTQSLELHAAISGGGPSPDRLKSTQSHIIVQDYTPFEHTEVYAEVQGLRGVLTADELGLLLRLARAIAPLYVVPSVLVYRPLSADSLQRRVQERNRPSEQAIDPAFLRAVSERFEQWVAGWKRSPVVRVDAEADVFNDSILHEIAVKIERALELKES